MFLVPSLRQSPAHFLILSPFFTFILYFPSFISALDPFVPAESPPLTIPPVLKHGGSFFGTKADTSVTTTTRIIMFKRTNRGATERQLSRKSVQARKMARGKNPSALETSSVEPFLPAGGRAGGQAGGRAGERRSESDDESYSLLILSVSFNRPGHRRRHRRSGRCARTHSGPGGSSARSQACLLACVHAANSRPAAAKTDLFTGTNHCENYFSSIE